MAKVLSNKFYNRVVKSVNTTERLTSGTPGMRRRGGAFAPGLIAKVTGPATGGGYYEVEIYLRNEDLFDVSTGLTAAKLLGTKVSDGYGYTLQEIGTSLHSLSDVANDKQLYFRCTIEGYEVGDGLPVVEMVGNAIWLSDCP